MLSHKRVWAAIDALAARHDLSASGLAKRAGLDSTTFNKSKRFSADGRPRWPSTESLAKIMDATGASFDEFIRLLDAAANGAQPTAIPAGGWPATVRDVPLLGLAQAGAGGYFDDAGFPAGQGWETIPFPGTGLDEGCYALEITGNSMEPLYREGDIIIVSPTARIRNGDRVVVKTGDGEVMAKTLLRQTSVSVELQSVNPEHPDRTFASADIEWMARIIWASQ